MTAAASVGKLPDWPGRPRRWPVVLVGVVIAIAVLVLLWNWDWFRPLIEHEASAALGRQVTMARFDVDLARRPRLKFYDLAVANPASFPPGSSLLTVRRLSLRIDPVALLHHMLSLTSIEIVEPRIDLRTNIHGTPNWRFASAATGGGWHTSIDSIEIDDGTAHLFDPALKADFEITFNTWPGRNGGPPQLLATANGRYAGQPIVAGFVGGSILKLRDPAHPYPVEFSAVNGNTRIHLQGSLLDPLHFGGANLKLTLIGNSLADLYPLTAIPLPATPPFQLTGNLDYASHSIGFRDFNGTVGSSDLEGNLSIALDGKRPLVSAVLTSRKIVLADLAGFIGATPGKPGAANTTPQLKRAQAAQQRRARVLPDTPINLPKLRSADLDIRYTGQRIEDSGMPLDDISAHLTAVDGLLKLDPLSFGVGQGKIVAHIVLYANATPVHAQADVDFRHINLRRLTRGSALFKGAGVIGGRLELDTTGNSVAKMLGNGNGGLKLFMGHGNLSALVVDLAGLDFGNAVLAALDLPKRTQLRCMVADMGLKNGIMSTRTLLLDTKAANILGSGSIDFRNETLDYKLTTDPKQFSIGALHAPIDVGGTFRQPSVSPDTVTLGTRSAAAVALGVVLTPLAALIPTIQLGMGKNHDCSALLDEVRKARVQGPDAVIKPLPRGSAKTKR